VTSIFMLVTLIGMFAEDFYRGWKVEQRIFRDVEEEMGKRQVLASSPTDKSVDELAAIEKNLQSKKDDLAAAKTAFEKGLGDLPSRKLKKELEFAGVKAEYDSVMSFINKASESREDGLNSEKVRKLRKQLDEKAAKMAELKEEVEKNQTDYDSQAREKGIPAMEAEVKKLDKQYKETLADFDRFVKLATQKRWSWMDSFRDLPIIEGFSPPTKIQQYTLNDLPIDYSFKFVTRYDRCATCHLGLEKPNFDKAALASLTDDPGLNKELSIRYAGAEGLLKKRRAEGERGLPKPEAIRPKMIDKSRLTDARVSEFAAHPRLDLFVDANSPHGAEKFGCTICHSGQGSATAFFDASHTPDNAVIQEHWKKEYGWKANHYWDMPMLPSRFVESTCVKCHHDVTDVIRDGNRIEAPKLVKGYNLVRELGCFGCHEIAGLKFGQRIGPDLRLEDDPPLDSLSNVERAKRLSDPLNPPGAQRKVGPALSRLAEKTNEDWVKAWLKSPRGFRPETRMPHFYLQANNNPEALYGTGQEKFPDAEINSVAYYLLSKSKQHLNELEQNHKDPKQLQADQVVVATIIQKIKDAEKQLTDPKLKDAEKATVQGQLKQLQTDQAVAQAKVKRRQEFLALAPPVSQFKLPAAGDANRGRMFFQEKGCMACHSHAATEKNGEPVDGKKVPAMLGDASFGPDLSRIALKIAPLGEAGSDRKWLISWLLNPSAHSPRTLMPSVQLTTEDANDIVAWLLSHKPEWKDKVVVEPAEKQTLQDLAKIYLEKVFTKSETRTVLENGITEDRLKSLALGADELELAAPLDENKLKLYVGKKAIGNMGCYACHSIPGFQNPKPIGTALNEWGKKDPDRLAFEDSEKYVKHHFNVVPLRDDPKDKNKPAKDWHSVASPDGKVLKPYEEYFADMLNHHHRSREGFLHLKLREPRSYDYNRIKSWDDRLRMPQFRFARPKKLAGESDEAFAARALQEEAEANEAVMTFILGLVAEPVPQKFVNSPTGDRLAEVKGRQVLDKFNCAGCHIVRPGSIDFKPVEMKRFEGHPNVRKEELPYTGDDYVYSEHIAWAGRDPTSYEKLTVRGVTPPVEVKFDDDEEPSKDVKVWLMQDFRYRKDLQKNGWLRDIPAGSTLFLSPDWVAVGETSDASKFTAPQLGGKFTDLLSQYLQKKDRENFGGQAKMSNAYAAAPPLLIGQGEKVQPDWLYKFLLNPHPIRPLTVLRMPKFNMSPDEAQALVNYFAAVDKTQNPGIGLTYPYVLMPQRNEGFLRQKTDEYVARLKALNQFDARKKDLQGFWEKQLIVDKADADRKLAEAEDRLNMAVAAAKPDATKQRDDAKKVADEWKERLAKKDVSAYVKQWEEREAYVADAGRMVGHGNICLTCHHAAGLDGKENKGPNLDNVADRLRHDWMQRWVTNPSRFQHYSSVMPINFKASGAPENQDAFVGSSMDQIQAARDFLLLYPQIRDWPILRARPILGLTTPPMGAK
jgi:cytochrome c2